MEPARLLSPALVSYRQGVPYLRVGDAISHRVRHREQPRRGLDFKLGVATALTEFEVAVAPHDLAAAHYRIAKAHHTLDHPAETRSRLLTALEIVPHFWPAQKLLLEITPK